MKNEELNPSEEIQGLGAKEVSLESSVDPKDGEEKIENSDMNVQSNFAEVDEDEMIVLLDDCEEFDSLSAVPLSLSVDETEEPNSDDFEDLPEMSVELVDDLPEVEDVEEITSLVEEGEGDFADGLNDEPIDIVEQVREWAVENWKPGVLAAAMLFTVSLVLSSLWSNVSTTESLAVEPSKSAIAIVDFENWVDEILDQHIVGTGTEEK